MKQCVHCGEWKQVGDFHKAPRNRGGRESRCKPCRYEQTQAALATRREIDPERVLNYYRKYDAKGQKLCVCPTCGEGFLARRRRDPKREQYQIYCSVSCKAKATAKRGSENPLYTPLVPIKCNVCGKVRHFHPSVAGRRKFCSRLCADDAMRTASDYIYGPTWPRQRRQALVRDERTCQHCGSTETIHVHHRIPYRISKSNALKNLVCLCASCHTTEEHRLRAEEDRSFEQLRIKYTARIHRRRAA